MRTIGRSNSRAAGGMSTVGLEVLLSLLFGCIGGYWLDEHFETAPWLMAVGLVFGVVTAGRFLYRAQKRAEKDLETDGFRKSLTDRPARFALDQKEKR